MQDPFHDLQKWLTNLPANPNINRPYAYDVTEGRQGRPRVLGVKRGTVACAIAKHAASGPTPACHTAGPARARAPTESQRSFSTACARSATSLDPQHGVVVMEMWRQCIRSIVLGYFELSMSGKGGGAGENLKGNPNPSLQGLITTNSTWLSIIFVENCII